MAHVRAFGVDDIVMAAGPVIEGRSQLSGDAASGEGIGDFCMGDGENISRAGILHIGGSFRVFL